MYAHLVVLVLLVIFTRATFAYIPPIMRKSKLTVCLWPDYLISRIAPRNARKWMSNDVIYIHGFRKVLSTHFALTTNTIPIEVWEFEGFQLPSWWLEAPENGPCWDELRSLRMGMRRGVCWPVVGWLVARPDVVTRYPKERSIRWTSVTGALFCILSILYTNI